MVTCLLLMMQPKCLMDSCPTSLHECFRVGSGLDMKKLLVYYNHQHEELLFSISVSSDLPQLGVDQHDVVGSTAEDMQQGPPAKKTRQNWGSILKKCDNSTGTMRSEHPKETPWYWSYVLTPDLSSKKLQTAFRKCFWLPYSEFVKLVEDTREEHCFPRWMNALRYPSPLELLIRQAWWSHVIPACMHDMFGFPECFNRDCNWYGAFFE